ncbi:MAG TPA: GAF and ANTAR domain-containing protein [Acidimicrobiia bacterium]|jgi:transcriptional regulator with GAF, ATPase, and Fis domain|nr:GAF and ANTAR domain-containing protein [Acidimicrobiia bacterium]
MTSREERLVGVFVKMADTLVRDFDVLDLFKELVDGCTELLDAEAAGLLLADEDGALRVAAASSEAAHLVQVLESQNDGGPGAEAFLRGEPAHWDVETVESTNQAARWSDFAQAANLAGYSAATAVPMRLRHDVIGALTIFRVGSEPIVDEDLVVLQAVADLATIAILQHRAAIDDQSIIDQLQTALDSRVAIEQAKGMVAQDTGLEMDEAFALIRGYARDNNERLRTVAEKVASGVLEPEQLRRQG